MSITRIWQAKDSRRARLLVLSALLWLPAEAGQAFFWFSPKSPIERLPATAKDLTVHPFLMSKAIPAASSFGLFNKGQLSFQDAVQALIADQLPSALLEARATSIHTGLGLATGGETLDYRFFVGGIPLCGFQVRAHALGKGGALILGTLPNLFAISTIPLSDWPSEDRALEQAKQNIKITTGARQAVVMDHSRCLYVASARLLPVWRSTIEANGLPYRVLSNAYETLNAEPAFFDVNVDGTAKAYEFNRLNGEASDVPLHDLIGDGTLSSTYLRTVVPAGFKQAQSDEHNFSFETNDVRFDEVQAYVHAQTHFEWFEKLGFEWYGPKPIEIKIHIKPDGRPNNALFVPGSGNTLPSINIDDGDGIELQNLVSDGDVVSHEFGHHVIYKTLRQTSGESLVLHEGLADFFTFARTGDPCLGESICPAEGGACFMQGQCLRTADNSIAYNDDQWQTWAARGRLGHLHGQMVSGLLWSLRKTNALPAEELAALVFKAISYFRENSGFRDLVLALLTADRELYECKYNDKLRDIAESRGLKDFVSDVAPGCDTLPSLNGAQDANDSESTTGGTKKSKKGDENPFKCGTIATPAKDPTRLMWLCLLCLPLLFAMRPMPAKAKTFRRNRRL